MPPRFFLCDPSIEGRGGHYLTYAERVLGAATAAGFDPVLVANRSFRPEAGLRWTVRTPFEFNCWRQRSVVPAPQGMAFSAEDRRFLRLKYSDLGLCWVNAGNLAPFRHYNEAFPLPDRMRRVFRRVDTVRRLAHALYDAAPTEARRAETEPEQRAYRYRLWRGAIIKAMRVLRQDGAAASLAALDAAGGDPGRRRDFDALNESGAAALAFQRAVLEISGEFDLSAADHLFFPTMTSYEMSGLRSALLQDERSRAPNYHLLFRRNVYDGYSDSFDAQEWMVHPLRTGFALLAEIAGDLPVFFYTDTEQLSAQYNRFDAVTFETVPIPVDVAAEALAISGYGRDGNAAAGQCTASDAAGAQPAWHVLFAVLGRQNGWLDWLEALLLAASAPVDGKTIAVEVICKTPPDGADGTELDRLAMLYPRRLRVRDAETEEAFAQVWRTADLVVSIGDYGGGDPQAHLLAPALAAGIPVVLDHRSALAVTLAAATPEYHQRTIADDEVLIELGNSPRRYRWQADRVAGRNERDDPQACDHDGVRLTADPVSYTWLLVPSAATHLWLTFEREHQRAGEFAGSAGTTATGVLLDFHGGERQEIEHCELVVADRPGDAGCGRRSVVVAVPAGTVDLRLGLRNVEGSDGDRVPYLQLRWLRSADAPAAMAGGLAYSAVPDRGMTGQALTDGVRRVLANHRQYRQSIAGAGAKYGESRGSSATDRDRTPSAGKGGPLVIAYLGDARREKGFHHLPALQAAIAERHGEGARFMFQSYITSLDTSILTAREQLRHAAGSVELIERALDEQDYNRFLLHADVILVPYSRRNYIARSSGIFAEALANGKPVVVAAGTWMAAQLASLSNRFHQQYATSSVIAERNGLSCAWSLLDSNQPRSFPAGPPANSLPIFRHQTSFTTLPVGQGTTHVWLSFRHRSSFPDTHTRIVFALLSEAHGGAELDRYDTIVGGCGDELISVILPVRNAAARSIWLGLHSAFADTSYEIEELQLRWLQSARPVPVLPGGVTYIEEGSDEQQQRHLIEALDLLLAGYPEYRSSAETVAPDWARFHSAAMLVDILREPRAGALRRLPHDRFTTREWGSRAPAVTVPESSAPEAG